MRPDAPRDPYAGPEAGPSPPFPLKLSGPVIKGFGRGSKDLGIPTANIPVSGVTIAGHDDLTSGVYFGFAGLEDSATASVSSSTSDAALHISDPGSAQSNLNTTTGQSTSGTSFTGTGTGTGTVYPMVMSLGYNPFYKNSARSVEVHIMHDFAGADFYGAQLKLLILGFIRPEYDYVSRDALIEDIKTDIEVARRSLLRDKWAQFGQEKWLVGFDHRREGA